MGALTQMLSLGPRGLRVSRCDPGTQNVAPESGPTSTMYLVRAVSIQLPVGVCSKYCPMQRTVRRSKRIIHASIDGRNGYHTMLRLMQTSGNGWRIGPPCASAPRSLKSCGLSCKPVSTSGLGTTRQRNGELAESAILLRHQSVCHSRPCGPRFSFGPTSKPPNP